MGAVVGIAILAIWYFIKYFIGALFVIATIRWVKWVWED